jgi:hypothetical protein
MTKRSVDDFDLDEAVVDKHGNVIEEGDIAPARRGKRAAVFLKVPAQVMARMEIRDLSSPEAWCVLCALQWLEFLAEKKRQPIRLTNAVPRMFGVNRKLKYRGLDELVARGFVLPYTKSARASPLIKLNMKLQK